MSIGSISPVTAVLLADTKEYSAKLDEASAKMEEFGGTSATAGERVAGVWNKMSSVILGAGVGIAAVSVDLALKYSEALDTMQRTTNLTSTQMDYLKGKILDVSTATATSAELITTGETQLIKAGVPMSQSLTDVGQAAKFAQATSGNLNDTLTSAIGIMRQHIGGTHSIAQSLNIMDVAIKNSQLTSDELNTALSGKSLSTFAAYHVDLRTATTLLAGFADENLTGTKALMALKGGYTDLDAPVTSTTGKITQSAKTLDSLKLSQTTLAAEARKPGGMLQVLQQINTAFNENGTAQQKALGIASIMQQIFGTSAGPAYTNLINELPKLLELYNKTGSSTGAVNSSFSQFLNSPGGAVAKFKTALENAAIRIGDVVLPKLTVGLIDATRLVTDIASSPTDTHLVEGAAATVFAAALATKASGVGISIAEAFGVKVAGGLSTVIGTSIGLGIATYLLGHPSNAEFGKAKGEWEKNKIGGAYDVTALTVNTFTGAVNKLIGWLPGHPAIPQAPIVGPNQNPYVDTQVKGHNADRSPIIGPKPKGKVTINVGFHK